MVQSRVRVDGDEDGSGHTLKGKHASVYFNSQDLLCSYYTPGLGH